MRYSYPLPSHKYTPMKNPNNKLSQQTSPYLLQHADNPVNWYPWGQQALDKARAENKPVLLSVGYSACHWCHVMAHESFENEQTAAIMNEHFINIKVDREERPDLDKIYQASHSLLTSRSGGWPLTVFLSPDTQIPFFAGTYFPDRPAYGMPSFNETLNRVHDIFLTRKDDIAQQDTSLMKMLGNTSSHSHPGTAPLNNLPLDLAREQLESEFDHINGGFSSAPKFPHPPMLMRCIRHWALMRAQQLDDERMLEIALFSLEKMARGGAFDQLGGGFYRYSVDEYWMIPHFEKMLYDNGQLLTLYSHAYQITGRPIFRHTAEQTARWVIREMQSTEGGYYSALDADSEGIEGRFYSWDNTEIEQLLDEKDYPVFASIYGLDRTPNFEQAWHLHTFTHPDTVAATLDLTTGEMEQCLSRCRTTLLAARNKRMTPGRDDKVLCAWNGLMIHGMVIAGKALGQPELVDSARSALDFIHKKLWHNYRLLATCKDNTAHLNAYLDDHAYLLSALLEYLQLHWDNHYYAWALEIAEILIKHFQDEQTGAFYFTSNDHEQLILRSMTFNDEAIPSGNGIAAQALFRLGLLSGNGVYLASSENCIKTAYAHLQTHALNHCSLLNALEDLINKPVTIILRGEPQQLKEWQASTHKGYAPALMCFAIDSSTTPPDTLAHKQCKGDICAYICEGMQCLPVITDKQAFDNYINGHTYYENNQPL